ncbi:hypothetical protein BHE74_00017860 [Ensete ventricosum]|nr:hypothetical protein BHE74_00017860 [Ensete ventricosum]
MLLHTVSAVGVHKRALFGIRVLPPLDIDFDRRRPHGDGLCSLYMLHFQLSFFIIRSSQNLHQALCKIIQGCHARVSTPEAQLALPELALGVVPGMGGVDQLM